MLPPRLLLQQQLLLLLLHISKCRETLLGNTFDKLQPETSVALARSQSLHMIFTIFMLV